MNKTSIVFQLTLAAPLALFIGCVSPTEKSATAAASPPPVSPGAMAHPEAKPVLPPSAAKVPLPFEGEGWQVMFDGNSLAGWKVTEFSGHGAVNIESGVVILNTGDPFTGLNWTNSFPKMNYEIALDAMRVSGSDFFCGLTMPVGTNFCSLIVGGWGGSLVGISSIDGADASENETTKFDSFDTDRWYRIRLRVTTDRIEAWIDGDKMVDLVTAGHGLSVRAGEIELSEPLGICAWQTTAAMREIRYREVSEPASPAKKRP